MEMLHKNPPAGILDQKKLFIFDMDGTIYLGKLVFDYAIRFIRHLRADEACAVLHQLKLST